MVGVRSVGGELERQRLRAAVELAVGDSHEMEQRVPRNAANNPMTAPVATRCGQMCANCPGRTWRWAKCAVLATAAVAFALVVAVVALAVAPDAAPLCHYEGRSFSVGSLIVVPGDQGRECRESEMRRGANWYPVRIK